MLREKIRRTLPRPAFLKKAVRHRLEDGATCALPYALLAQNPTHRRVFLNSRQPHIQPADIDREPLVVDAHAM